MLQLPNFFVLYFFLVLDVVMLSNIEKAFYFLPGSLTNLYRFRIL